MYATSLQSRSGPAARSWCLALVFTGLFSLAACGDAARTADGAALPAQAVISVDGAPLGSVGLSVTCTGAAEQPLLRGLALLHHMTYEEAAAQFAQATSADPDCALGYWGLAMTNLHPLWPDVISADALAHGREMLTRARQASTRGELDDAFIAALAAYYDDAENRTEQERLASFAQGWQRVYEAHPSDAEATAFYALAILAAARGGDPSFAAQEQAGALVEGLLGRIPDHPGANHYAIHAYDFPPLADRALDVARIYGSVAPDNAHALHMTSHIFTRLGLWDESIEFNQRSADAALAQPIGGAVSYHHLHALDYLAYAHLQAGDEGEAKKVLDHVMGLEPPLANHPATAYALAAIPVRLALERQHWEEAVQLAEHPTDAVPWDRYPHLAALPVFGRTLGAARLGNVSAADSGLERLAELQKEAERLPTAYDWGTQVKVLHLSAAAWIEMGRGNRDEALQLAGDAADLEDSTDKNPVTPGSVLPARELYADLLLETGFPEQALEAYEASLRVAKNRLRSLYGAGRAAELRGDPELARSYFVQVLNLAGNSELPVVAHAREFVEAG